MRCQTYSTFAAIPPSLHPWKIPSSLLVNRKTHTTDAFCFSYGLMWAGMSPHQMWLVVNGTFVSQLDSPQRLTMLNELPLCCFIQSTPKPVCQAEKIRNHDENSFKNILKNPLTVLYKFKKFKMYLIFFNPTKFSILPFPSNRKHKHNCYCAQEIHSGLQQPVGVVHCGDGSQRLFILEREGFVWILTHDMELLKEPFLDIHKLVQSGLKVSGT